LYVIFYRTVIDINKKLISKYVRVFIRRNNQKRHDSRYADEIGKRKNTGSIEVVKFYTDGVDQAVTFAYLI